jgi:hypothetical protein
MATSEKTPSVTDNIVAVTNGSEVAGIDLSNVDWSVHAPELGEQIKFDNIGDTFVGKFVTAHVVGMDDGDTFTVLEFIGLMSEPAGVQEGKPYSINAGWKLQNAFNDIDAGTLVALRFVKEFDTGQASPLKDIVVLTGK